MSYHDFNSSSSDKLPWLRLLPFASNSPQLQEWVLDDGFASRSSYRWHNPLFFISALIGKNLSNYNFPIHQWLIAWVGRRCWPVPHVLEQTLPKSLGVRPWSWKHSTLFLNPETKDKRLWSSIQLLHNPLTAAIVVDGSGFDLTATRRLKLALGTDNSTKSAPSVFLLRPPWEAQTPSAAQVRWTLSPANSATAGFSWSLTLTRAPGLVAPQTWSLLYENNSFRVLSEVAVRAPDEGTSQSARRAS